MFWLFTILWFLSVLALLVGLIKPSLVLPFIKVQKTRKKSFFIYLGLSILFFIIIPNTPSDTFDKENYEIEEVSKATSMEENKPSARIVTKEERKDILGEVSNYMNYARRFCELRKTATRQYPIYEAGDGQLKFIRAKEGRYLTEEDCSVIMTYLVQVGLKEETIKNVVEQKRWIGMGPIELTYVVGMPDDMNKSVSESFGGAKQNEQWVFYGGGGHTMYVYFEDGRVTGWQDY